ncbi:nucleotide sugar dehydrogenase [Acinetobacter boissieri]|uniref:UDP-glucose 6-dehydrogenase n=1 Tax=Acinetobacter boissieri TaxID=1219383 RepID=A0A1G6JHD7_9GAMM|nr:nucleotide sugar dehydrogenase [Acinetobacter boissieri]SDC18154.1 UDPglucose 6-dehydrogenase [Acinetobacter boissieri]
MKIAVYGTTLHAGVMASLFAEYGHQVFWCQYPTDKDFCSVVYQDKAVNELINKQIIRKSLQICVACDIPMSVDVYFFAFNSNEYTLAQQVLKDIQNKPVIHPKLMVNGSSFGLEGTKKLQAIATKDDWCYLPDMVQEGNTLDSVTKVEHIVIGIDGDIAKQKIKEVLRPFYNANHHYLFMPILDAEFTKLSVSGMLATRISYMNDLAQVAEKLNVDIANVRLGLGADSRIGSSYIAPGVGFGGENFSQDILTLTQTIEETGIKSDLLEQVWAINEQQKELLFRKLWRYYQCDLKGKTVAIWGASFKENTPRINFSPIHTMLEALWAQGVTVQLHDPEALPLIAKKYGPRSDLILCESRYEAVENADALCLLTAWKQYLSLDYARLHQLMKHPLILDGRNVYDAAYVKSQGFAYEGVGRI